MKLEKFNGLLFQVNWTFVDKFFILKGKLFKERKMLLPLLRNCIQHCQTNPFIVKRYKRKLIKRTHIRSSSHVTGGTKM